MRITPSAIAQRLEVSAAHPPGNSPRRAAGSYRPHIALAVDRAARHGRSHECHDHHGRRQGIGAVTALLAAERGYAVVVNFRSDAQSAEALVQRIAAAGGRAIAIAGDVSRGADVEALFARADAAFGVPAGLVNNAGIVAATAHVDEMDEARLARMFAVNVTRSFQCAREAVRRMSTRHGGRGGVIVNASAAAAKPAGSATTFWSCSRT